MDTALTQKFPFIFDGNLSKANCTGNRVYQYSCNRVGCESTNSVARVLVNLVVTIVDVFRTRMNFIFNEKTQFPDIYIYIYTRFVEFQTN